MSAPRLRAYHAHVHVVRTLRVTVTAASDEDAFLLAIQATQTKQHCFEEVNATTWGPYLKRLPNEEVGA
ncbi:hypothetical protein N182_34115 [Sinorhizobium sp. GL2]|nr:hypothetical protein N182_34115 [Sinorhizobium sp. GL2]